MCDFLASARKKRVDLVGCGIINIESGNLAPTSVLFHDTIADLHSQCGTQVAQALDQTIREATKRQ